MGDWEVIYTAKPWAGEPEEGKEVDWEAKEWRGESHTLAYDDDYPRMPRLTLKEKHVVNGSIVVTLKDSAQELAVTDYTTSTEEAKFYETWPVPPKYHCYAHRRKGEDYDECYLYFNPGLEGEAVDVVYRYFLADAEITWPVVFAGNLYFNEAGDRHRFVEIYREGGEAKVENTYSPRAGDREVGCACAGDDRIWAISEPSKLLVHFAKEWSGYIHEVKGAGKKIWQLVADLARAGNLYCLHRLDTLSLVRRDTASRTGTFPRVLKISHKDLKPYEKVSFSYASGKVESGSGKPVLSLSCSAVHDKGHARILCDAAYAFYAVRRREFTIECAGVLEQIGLGEEKEFEYQGRKYAGIVTARGFQAQGTTTFTVVEKVVAASD